MPKHCAECRALDKLLAEAIGENARLKRELTTQAEERAKAERELAECRALAGEALAALQTLWDQELYWECVHSSDWARKQCDHCQQRAIVQPLLATDAAAQALRRRERIIAALRPFAEAWREDMNLKYECYELWRSVGPGYSDIVQIRPAQLKEAHDALAEPQSEAT